jgi:hypothetical protein
MPSDKPKPARRRGATGKQMSVIDLNKMHHAIHQISGDMALRFNKATVDDLKRWAKMLRELARDMEEAAE